MKYLQSSYRFSTLTSFSVYPARPLKSLHACHTYHCITGTLSLQVTYLLRCLFQPIVMNPESSAEQSIKALQAQNAQFQGLIMNLTQGQQDLKALLLKKDKKKKRTVLFSPRRRSGTTPQVETERTTQIGRAHV